MSTYKLVKKYPSLPKDWEIGMEIGLGDRNYGYSPCSGKYTDFRKLDNSEVENYPEFWQKVVQKDYEVLKVKIKTCGTIITYNSEGKATHRTDGASIKFTIDLEKALESKNTEIYAVRRLNNGEIFTVGDTIISGGGRQIITDFIIQEDEIRVNYKNPLDTQKYWNYLKNVLKIKESLFITEDGKEIFQGDKYYFVVVSELNILDPYTIKTHVADWANTKKIPLGRKQFSTKEAAWEYILMNKPCLSINDVNNAYPSPKESPLHNELINRLKELVKLKINTN